MTSFRLAKMSPMIATLTVALSALPLVFAVLAFVAFRPLGLAAALMAPVYAWVWLRFRPTRFVVHPHALEVIWPLKRRTIRRDAIASARLVDGEALRREIGWGMRVGAGGLWGGFGWLWTSRRGIVHMYVSRTDGFVWIECTDGRPWLITPERPDAFVESLSAR